MAMFHPGKKGSTLVVANQTPFALLSPKHTPARTRLFRAQNDLSFLATCTSETVTALDFETKGNDPCAPDTRVVGVGLSNASGSVYYTEDN